LSEKQKFTEQRSICDDVVKKRYTRFRNKATVMWTRYWIRQLNDDNATQEERPPTSNHTNTRVSNPVAPSNFMEISLWFKPQFEFDDQFRAAFQSSRVRQKPQTYRWLTSAMKLLTSLTDPDLANIGRCRRVVSRSGAVFRLRRRRWCRWRQTGRLLVDLRLLSNPIVEQLFYPVLACPDVGLNNRHTDN
jgi:hypothetical protein